MAPKSYIIVNFSAHELAQQQRKNFGEVISSAVRHAKKMVMIFT